MVTVPWYMCGGQRITYRVSSAFPSYCFQGLNSANQVWQHAPLPTDLPCSISSHIIFEKKYFYVLGDSYSSNFKTVTHRRGVRKITMCT